MIFYKIKLDLNLLYKTMLEFGEDM